MTIEEALDIVGERWPRTGKLHCPAHPDKTPSLQLYKKNDSFYCFSCSRNGDAFGLIALLADMPIKDVLRKYAGPGAEKPKVAKKVSEHDLRKELELRLVTATQPIFDAINRTVLTDWVREIVQDYASDIYNQQREALREATPYEAEMLLRQVPRLVQGFIASWDLEGEAT